jgi:hypothetical protein
MALRDLRNLGRQTEAQLKMIGTHSLETLRRRGAIESFIDLKLAFPGSISLNFLYALTAALLTELEPRIALIQTLDL